MKNPQAANQDALYYQHGCRFVLVLPDGSVKYAKTLAGAEAAAQAQGAALYALTDTEGRTTRASTAKPAVRQSPVAQVTQHAPQNSVGEYAMSHAILETLEHAVAKFYNGMYPQRRTNTEIQNFRSAAEAFLVAASADLGIRAPIKWTEPSAVNDPWIVVSGTCAISAPEAGLYLRVRVGGGPSIEGRGCSPKDPHGGFGRFKSQWANPGELRAPQAYDQFLAGCRDVMLAAKRLREEGVA